MRKKASTDIQAVFCGICGFRTETALFEHVRTEHGLDAAGYEQKCPGAPLFTEAFGRYVSEHGLDSQNGRLMSRRTLFGRKIVCDMAPAEHVPAMDDAYEFDEKLARNVLLSLEANDRILLVGPTGCGKSSLVMQLAARLNWPLTRANLHGETSANDFVGQWVVEKGEMVFRYGLLPRAMKDGHILILEELDAAEPAILFVLQGVLEENGKLVLAEKGGEIVEPHPRFRLVATANTLGLGDESGLYTGTRVLNASHLDRWAACYAMSYLPPAAEEQLLVRKTPGLARKTAEALVRLAGAVREARQQDQVFCEFSTRRLLALGRKLVLLKDLNQALEIAVLNKLAANDRKVVYELTQRHLPEIEGGAA